MTPPGRNRGGSRSKSANRRRRQKGRGRGPARIEGAGFWGSTAKLPSERPDVHINEDAAAVVRSLGPPPLSGHETIAEHYFAAVYDRAVGLAGALAAAGGLIKPEELEEERSD
jgi:hypothetical protein